MSDRTESNGDVDHLILAAIGSPEKIERFIADNQAYINSKVSRYGAGLTSLSRDELHSIASLAFYEAMRTYKIGRGHFYPFADMVIKRRIIDEVRRSSRNSDIQTITLDEDAEEYGQSRPVQDASIENFKKEVSRNLLAEEIDAYTKELNEWGISFSALVDHSPHHSIVRELYNTIIRAVMEDEGLLKVILEKKYYPVKKIQEISRIPRKKIERSRIYVISVIIALTGDYEVLTEYMPDLHGSGEDI